MYLSLKLKLISIEITHDNILQNNITIKCLTQQLQSYKYKFGVKFNESNCRNISATEEANLTEKDEVRYVAVDRYNETASICYNCPITKCTLTCH